VRTQELTILSKWVGLGLRLRGAKKISVDRPLAIIGDIHGRADLLEKMLQRLHQKAPKAHKVFVGDYIDRGPSSKEVLGQLVKLTNTTCLLGNHERMMLDFLSDPCGKGARWLRHGGYETAQSFGLHEQDAEALQKGLSEQIDVGTVEWLNSLPLFYKSGSLYVTHAIPNPNLPIENQSEDTLVWGHPASANKRRVDGYWVAHGHTIVSAPQISRGRIAIDTGAFATDRLTAALLDNSSVNFEVVTTQS